MILRSNLNTTRNSESTKTPITTKYVNSVDMHDVLQKFLNNLIKHKYGTKIKAECYISDKNYFSIEMSAFSVFPFCVV